MDGVCVCVWGVMDGGVCVYLGCYGWGVCVCVSVFGVLWMGCVCVCVCVWGVMDGGGSSGKRKRIPGMPGWEGVKEVGEVD